MHVLDRGRLGSFIGLAAGVVGVSSTMAVVIRVPDHYPTIQEAINAAESGDDIVIAPGRYLESIVIPRKSIRIRGQGGGAATIIDGDGTTGYVVKFGAGTRDASLETLTVTGAAGTISENIDYGGGIIVDRAFDILLRDVTITGNSGQYGGAFYCKGGSAVLDNCSLLANVGGVGGAIAAQLATVSVRWSRIEGNTSYGGGGGIWVSGGQCTVEDTMIDGNFAVGAGAGLFATSCTLNAARCTISRNGREGDGCTNCITFETSSGGGLYVDSVVGGRLVDCRIEANMADLGSGLFFANGGTFDVVNTAIADNVGGLGAGLYVDGTTPHLVGCTIVGNSPGGVYATFGSEPTVVNSILSENQTSATSDDQVYGGGTTHISYSLINGSVVNGADMGAGVVFGSPRLDGGLRPKPGSPAIDAGNNGAVPADVLNDLGGKSRFIDDPETVDSGLGITPLVDMGALEYSPGTGCIADYDGDGFVTGEDHTRFVRAFEHGSERADIDGDGFITGADFDIFAWAFIEGC